MPLPEPPAMPAEQNEADAELRSWLLESGIPSLPYFDGNPRIRSSPCFVPSRRMKALRTAAKAVCSTYDELCDILANDPSYLTGFFSLTRLQKMLWFSSGSLWHGIARADVFCTADGKLAVAEINSDTPSGVDEAYLLGEFASRRYPGFLNPNAGLREGFLAIIREAYRGLRSRAAVPAVALIYPTDIPEDQGMIVLYRRWLEESGYTVILGSPSNVVRTGNGRAALFGTEIDILFRHYKTDWWCERTNVWKDARQIPDAAPLLGELQNVLEPMVEGDLAVVNPFGAVITQSKLSLAFFHEHIHLFTAGSQEAIRRYIPLTKRLTSFEDGVLEREKDDWVLKSDYGCEGAEVIVGHLTGAEAWTRALRLAEPAHWIAQRYFRAEKQESGFIENYGVYLIGGTPSGLYVRLDRGVTGSTAVVVPALERPPLADRESHCTAPSGDGISCDGRVAGLMSAYTPGEEWLPFRMPLLLHSASDADLAAPFELTTAAVEACETGKALGELIGGADEVCRRSLLIISDIEGVGSVALGAALSDRADIVLQTENIAHPRESVPLRSTLGALIHFAPQVARGQARGGSGQRRSPAIILDRERVKPAVAGAGEFNNRHWAFLPTIRALEERGVETILYIHPEGEDVECDDLNEDFVQYARAGIRVCYATPLLIRTHGSLSLQELLPMTERTPTRRETVFSYMLPQSEEEVSLPYNKETAEP